MTGKELGDNTLLMKIQLGTASATFEEMLGKIVNRIPPFES